MTTLTPEAPNTEAPKALAVVDADSHLTDVDDLWTKRAPAKYKDEILHVEDIDGQRTWVVEGQAVGKAGGGSTIDKDGLKHPFLDSMVEWDFDKAHVAAWDIDARLEILDSMGIQHQVLYPNALGLGGQSVAGVKDPILRQLCIEIFNDSRAEIQRDTNNRLLPMPILPAWDIDGCVREAKRVAEMGLRGVNMTSDPQDVGSPDLANRAWDPLWEVCADLDLPVHFHIGSSLTAMNFFGQYFWESQDEHVKPAIGFFRLGEQAVDVRLLGNIALHRDGLAAGAGDFGNDLVRPGFAGGIIDDDRGAFRREMFGDGSADPF